MSGTYRLMGELPYGTGMRMSECLGLRVKDIDFGNNYIVVRDGKGMKDRITMLPETLKEPLTRHLARFRECHGHKKPKGPNSLF